MFIYLKGENFIMITMLTIEMSSIYSEEADLEAISDVESEEDAPKEEDGDKTISSVESVPVADTIITRGGDPATTSSNEVVAAAAATKAPSAKEETDENAEKRDWKYPTERKDADQE